MILCEGVKLDDYYSDSGDDTDLYSPRKQQQQQEPDYSRAFAVLNNPKYVTDLDKLQRFLDDVGVSEADDLAELDEEDLSKIFSHLKKISLKKFNRFLCRDVRLLT